MVFWRKSSKASLDKVAEVHDIVVTVDDFFGIPVSTDITGADKGSLVYLACLIIILLKKPSTLKKPSLAVAYWAVIVAVAYSIKTVTLYPLLSTILLTRTCYPWLIVLTHCIAAVAAYRREKQQPHVHYTSSLGMAFFCYGFGGSIVSDLLMGLPVTALAHARIVPCWLMAWFLVWFSPRDIVYRLLSDRTSVAFHFLNLCEAVDAVTTPMGRISRTARQLSSHHISGPILAGLLAGSGGAALRYAERVVLWQADAGTVRASREAIEGAVWKTLGYSIFWWYLAVHRCHNTTISERDLEWHHCRDYGGSDADRLAMVVVHVVWCLGCDLGWVTGHPFIFGGRILRNAGARLARHFRCGPPPPLEHNGDEKTEKLE